MATKGSKKLSDKLASLFHPGKDFRAQNKSQEQEILSLLNSINLADPNNKLPLKTVQECGYDQTISQAINKLKVPHFFNQNIQKLDNHVKFAIHALDLAIKEGYETTAESASFALRYFFRCLFAEIQDINVDPAHVETLKILISVSREFDALTQDIARQCKRLERKKCELAEKRAAMDVKRLTEEGVRAESEIAEYAHDPAMMSESARKLQDELYAIQQLECECAQLQVDIDFKNEMKQHIEADINHVNSDLLFVY